MKRHPSDLAQPGHLKEYGLMLEQTAKRRAALSGAQKRARTSNIHTIKAPDLDWKAPTRETK